MHKSQTKATSPDRRSRRKAATRARIIKSALDLLSKQEYGATTIEQITEAADVGKGTYFNYFPSKEHLLYEVGKEQLATVRVSVEKALTESGDTKKVFQELLLALTTLFADNPILARNLVLANLGNELARELMAKNVAERAKWLNKLVKKAQELGSIRRDIKPEMVAYWYQHIHFGNLMYWGLQPTEMVKNWVQFSFEQFWRSVATEYSDTTAERRETKG
ncbi:MAG: TetR/AcrR family transcriptional regulator [candidate division Zixibacteria bacterium]|nr:TetR/AcrR family transcriptional regulator [candidate division Zixibacteria bacterium]